MAYYLDLFDGNPETTGRSVLEAITGSATRSDITDDLEQISTTTDTGFVDVALTNPDVVVVSTASASVTNVSYVALYSASSGGTLLLSARIGATQTINKGNPVRFPALALTLDVAEDTLEVSFESTATLTATLTSISNVLFWGAGLPLSWGSSYLTWA